MTSFTEGRFHVSDSEGGRRTPSSRRLRLGIIGGGVGALIREIHAMITSRSNRWEIVAGALSSDPARSEAEWYIAPDRGYDTCRDIAEAESARPDGIDAVASWLRRRPGGIAVDADTARHSESWIEACATVYAEFAVVINARRSGWPDLSKGKGWSAVYAVHRGSGLFGRMR